jgi:hypothetical protein
MLRILRPDSDRGKVTLRFLCPSDELTQEPPTCMRTVNSIFPLNTHCLCNNIFVRYFISTNEFPQIRLLPSSVLILQRCNLVANMHLFHHFRINRLICAEIPSTTQLLLILCQSLSGRVVDRLRMLVLR